MPRKKWVLIFAVIFLAFTYQIACDTEGDDEAEGLGSTGGDDDGECGIDYDENPGCDTSDEACSMAVLINEDREAHPAESDCAPAIQWHDELAQVAYEHSKDMCDRGFFDHDNPDGQDPFDRMQAGGISFVAAGENIATGTDGVFTLADLEESFMDEPECELNHRGNILARDFTHVGIGAYHCADDGMLYVTQDFATFDQSDIRTDPHEYCD